MLEQCASKWTLNTQGLLFLLNEAVLDAGRGWEHPNMGMSHQSMRCKKEGEVSRQNSTASPYLLHRLHQPATTLFIPPV